MILTNKERIRSTISNIKNWSWDVFPKYSIEKEDAQAFQDIEALKEYIAEIEKYQKKEV